MIWFPELFYRFEEFEIVHPNQTSSVCEVSSVFVNVTTGIENEFCGDPLDDSVFFHTLVIGLACLPTSILLPLCVHRLRAKTFLGRLSASISRFLEFYSRLNAFVFFSV